MFVRFQEFDEYTDSFVLSGLDFTPPTPAQDQDETAPVIVVLHGLSGGEIWDPHTISRKK